MAAFDRRLSTRILWCVFAVGLLLFTLRLYFPKFERRYPLEYTNAKQSLKLGDVPAGRFIVTAVYFSNGQPVNGPEVKIEVNDENRRNIYSNIKRAEDRQYIFPAFENGGEQSLSAVVELFEPKQFEKRELNLWLKEIDRKFYYKTFYGGIVLMFSALIAIGATVLIGNRRG